MKKVFMFLLALAMVLGISMQAQAALTTIGQAEYGGNNYNLIWDNDSPFGSIVWLDYTNSYNTWQNQVDWAAGLNGEGVLTYNIDPLYNVTWGNDWRLSITVDGPYVYGYDGTTTGGMNITSSELGHLFYTELGNKGYFDTAGNVQTNYGLSNTGDFQNLLWNVYWSGTEYSANTTSAWGFVNPSGDQILYDKGYPYGNAIAARPGDVSVAVVPEPVSMILFGVGGVVLGARRKLLRRRG